MAINRELSQFAPFVSVNDSNRNVGIATTTLPNIGIGTLVPNAKFEVIGDTKLETLNVSGVSTLASAGGITTTGGDLYVGGDLYILDDLNFDEFNARNSNITGVGTITTLNSSNATITDLVGTGATITTLDNTSFTGVEGTITSLDSTDFVSTAGTITTLNSSNATITDLVGTGATITTLSNVDFDSVRSDITLLNVGTAATIGSLDVTGLTTTGSLAVLGVSTFFSDIDVKATAIVDALTVFPGPTNISGATTFFSAVTLASSGGITTTGGDFYGGRNASFVGVITATDIVSQNVTISGVSIFEGNSSDNLVRITQTGSGNALIVEDSTNPDSTPFVISSDGKIGLGTTNPTSSFHLSGIGSTEPYSDSNRICIGNYHWDDVYTTIHAKKLNSEWWLEQNSDDNDGVDLIFYKSRGIPNAETPVQLGDNVFKLTARAYRPSATGTGTTIRLSDWSGDDSLISFDVDDVSATTASCSMDFITGSSSRLKIKSNGNIGVGSTNPTSKLYVVGDAYVTGIITSTDYNSTSDLKLKENIQIIENPINKVMQLNGVEFDWKESGRSSMGVIAQEVEKVLPELVSGEDTKTVNYNGLIGLLIECVKELKDEINTLKNN